MRRSCCCRCGRSRGRRFDAALLFIARLCPDLLCLKPSMITHRSGRTPLSYCYRCARLFVKLGAETPQCIDT